MPDSSQHRQKRVNNISLLLQLAVGVVIVGCGGALAYLLYLQKTSPSSIGEIRRSETVDLLKVPHQTVDLTIRGNGTVRATRQLSVMPQVRGKVTWIREDLRVGDSVQGGSHVLTIDPTDYRLSVEKTSAELARVTAELKALSASRKKQEANIKSAESELAKVNAEAQIAREEYRRLRGEREPPPLVAKVPQVAAARQALQSAKAQLAQVEARREQLTAQKEAQQKTLSLRKLDLRRTRLALPQGGTFRIAARNVEIGTFVSPGQRLLKVYSVDSFEVSVPLRRAELQWLKLPTPHSPGGDASVTVSLGEEKVSWPAKLTRIGDVDQETRLVDVVVVLNPPKLTGERRIALQRGTFAEVSFTGKKLTGVSKLPRSLLHGEDNSEVWLYRDGKLAIGKVEVVYRGQGIAYVRGLPDGAQVVESQLAYASEGLPLTPREETSENLS